VLVAESVRNRREQPPQRQQWLSKAAEQRRITNWNQRGQKGGNSGPKRKQQDASALTEANKPEKTGKNRRKQESKAATKKENNP